MLFSELTDLPSHGSKTYIVLGIRLDATTIYLLVVCQDVWYWQFDRVEAGGGDGCQLIRKRMLETIVTYGT